MKRLFFHSYKKYLILTAYVILIVIINNSVKNDWKSAITYSNGLFIGGFSLLCYGGLSWVYYVGGFDFWQYAFSKKRIEGKRVTAYEWSEAKKKSRNRQKLPFGPYIFLGIITIILAILSFFVLK